VVEEHGVLAVAQAPHLINIVSAYYQQFQHQKFHENHAGGKSMYPAGPYGNPSWAARVSISIMNRRSSKQSSDDSAAASGDASKRTFSIV